ncbi:PhoH family protein [Alkaliphilus peptidifermentans]|uniref:PhoH-like protein n=1 Tax=Alkaliphilus peptidifermentans DSM 18978 TaxID=1120976 RepID=A0A1G5BUN0_9FIRM|nr:PhoH family protein [Alkaliphilus peptidifermentans]SCX93929.1 phosphate starvation-inducible protein PhoH [Alkaliphilus peptidifermentans DSM 18978]
MTNSHQTRIEIKNTDFTRELCGNFDKNVKLIQSLLNIDIVIREGEIVILGDEKKVNNGKKLIEELMTVYEKGEGLTVQNISYAINLITEGQQNKVKELAADVVFVTDKGKPIKPKTIGQKKYLQEIENRDLTFGIGPAGTGKTYLAVAMAVKAFRNEQVNRIILTRPAVEAGERLGFLPGDLKDKVDPYLRPLYDALFDILGVEKFNKYMERGMIEVAPLAYMRGRTLDYSFIILDEAQNTTIEQMKMFLTRLGFGSKAVVTGDITQIDLPAGKSSGLKNAAEVLKNVEDIGMVHLSDKDVVRHPLVQKIIKAYELNEHKQLKNTGDKGK